MSVCLCVCVSVKSNLTSGASVRPENTVTYSADNECHKICGINSIAFYNMIAVLTVLPSLN